MIFVVVDVLFDHYCLPLLHCLINDISWSFVRIKKRLQGETRRRRIRVVVVEVVAAAAGAAREVVVVMNVWLYSLVVVRIECLFCW